MNNTAVTLQTSKKVLIFLYVICIFVFLFLSLFFLHIKSEYFRKSLDARLASAMSYNGAVRAAYEGIDGDPLSKIDLLGLCVRPLENAAGKLKWFFTSNRATLELHPLSHIFSYLTRSGIPAELNFYASRLVVGGETTEIGVFSNKLSVDYGPEEGRALARFDTAFDIASVYVKTAQASPVTIRGTADIKNAIHGLKGFAAAQNVALAIPGREPGSRLAYERAGAGLDFSYDAEKKIFFLNSSEIRLDTCSVNIAKIVHGFSSGSLGVELRASGLNTADIFRAFPVAKLLVMSESAEIALEYAGNSEDLRGGSLAVRLCFTRARLLEYNTEENRVFSDVGAGDFVTSLGLTPELVARAETVEALISMRGREIAIESLRIEAPDYTFKASARADSNDRLDGSFTLSIPRRILKNNTLKADFSGMENGLKIYGKIMGDIYNPLIIYDMDGAAIIKITEGVMYDRIRNIFKK